MDTAISLIGIVSSAPMFVLGRLIRSGQRIDLISGINQAKVTGRAGLTRFVGAMPYAMGAAVIAACVGFARFGRESDVVTVTPLVVLAILTIRLLTGISRYLQPHK